MTRRHFVSLGAAAAACGSLRAQTVSSRVGAAQDLVCQGLELLSSHATPGQVSQAVGFLTLALDQYSSFGDARYYRALCLKRLGQKQALQVSDVEAAQRYGSEALRDGRDPFVLAVPKIYDNLTQVGQKWALLVGISRFQPDIGAESLRFADKDASSVAEALRNPSIGRFPAKNVSLLTNDAATTAAIKSKMNFIATRAKPEDMVLVYISTHGSSRTEDIKQVSYLYTYDTDVTSRDQVFGTALPMVDVANIIRTRCVAQRTVIIFDTCHSGSATASDALSTDDLDRLRDGAGRYVLSSCEPSQSSYETEGHGCFTASFLRIFGDHGGCIRMNDLFASVQKDVSETVSQRFHQAQRPIMAKSDRAAEIVLGVSPAGVAESCVATQTLQRS
jgi:hypothetical protein